MVLSFFGAKKQMKSILILVFIISIHLTCTEKANALYENDPSKSTDELLKQIRSSCMQNTSGNINNVALALPTYSALLVKLSNEASKTADKNIRMQQVITRLTIALFVLTCALLYIGWAQLRISKKLLPPKIVNFVPQSNKDDDSRKKD